MKDRFKNFNLVTGGKFSHTLGILAYALRGLPGKKYTIVYENGDKLVYEGTYTYENICAFDNKNAAFREREPVTLIVDDVSYDVRHDTVILVPSRKGKVSNKFGVFFPECWDLGRTLVTASNGENTYDFGRTFANYLGVMEGDSIVIHGPKFFNGVLNTQFGMIGFTGADDAPVPDVVPNIAERDDNTIYFVAGGEKKPVTLSQSFKMTKDNLPIAAKTMGGAICLVALMDASDRDPANKIYTELMSPITSNPKYANLEFPVEPWIGGKSSALHNEDLERLYDYVHINYAGNALVNKLCTLHVDSTGTVDELRILLQNGDKVAQADLYSEGGTDTNVTCAVHAAAACFYYNTGFNRDLSALSGMFFAYLAIVMSKGYTKIENITGYTNQSIELDTTKIMGETIETDKQYLNNVYFSGDLRPDTALFYRVLRIPAKDGSHVIAKLPGRKHYVCGKWDSSNGTVLVRHDSVVGTNYTVGQVIRPEGRVTTFAGIRTAFDGEMFTEKGGLTRRLEDSVIAFRFTGIGGVHA